MKTPILLPEDLTENAISTLRERLLQELGDSLTLIMFFGSRQKGEFASDSDIDMLIIIKEKNRKLIDRIFEIANEIENFVLSYRIPLSIHIRSEEEFSRFKKLKSPFIAEIEREGRIIYERAA
ncbi:MAG: nucleotidyltransferase domain-containing protein [Nitrospirae bacterium]|nr:nucleotidyltransferase domain-containing protein [Nitrospirota bacterium]